MANLILTTKCQNNCEYCFAKEDKKLNMDFSWGSFLVAVDFISKQEPKIINILGGEPTLHEDFCKMIDYLLYENFRIQIFTNGLISEKNIKDLSYIIEKHKPIKEQILFAVNVGQKDLSRQKMFFEKFNNIIYPSFTVSNPEDDLMFIPKLINDYRLDRYIRLGLALPIVGGKNKYLKLKDYPKVAKNIVSLITNTYDIKIIFDCGFPLCMFEIEDIKKLDMLNKYQFVCGEPLDIYPDLTVANCYPLSKIHKSKLRDFENIEDLYKFFHYGLMSPEGTYSKQCSSCPFFNVICHGGCKSFT